MLDRYLVAHCSPTLAGLKSANIFNYPFTSVKRLNKELEVCRGLLHPKGVSIHLLRRSGETALVYVCRSRQVQKELQKQEVSDFLSRYGYDAGRFGACLQLLRKRISRRASRGDFPHEIGLFLGYPLADVRGFIENKGKNCRCCGCWKVYGNEREARTRFARFEKCRKIYGELFCCGKDVARLTVSAAYLG